MLTHSPLTPEDFDAVQSLLFAPAIRPDRVAKALSTGADVVCIDLEDSVPAESKAQARAGALEIIAEYRTARLMLRINSLRTLAGLEDLIAVAEARSRPSFLMVPKVEGASEIEIVSSAIGDRGVGIVPLIESARGLRSAPSIAVAGNVRALMFGGGDLASELGVSLDWEPLLVARSQLLLACAEAGVGAIDVPYIRLDDEAGLEKETRRSKALGFSAKAAIHPSQIDTIHAIMRPTTEELAHARDAVDAYDSAGGGTLRFRGQLLEEPLMRRYRRVLALEKHQNA